ncbi:MAG TPA: hypothetical protein VHO25_01835 [Polyangiaceae bacterium]|nr:hypothetical protein [Polyangiaceae bacterium]
MRLLAGRLTIGLMLSSINVVWAQSETPTEPNAEAASAEAPVTQVSAAQLPADEPAAEPPAQAAPGAESASDVAPSSSDEPAPEAAPWRVHDTRLIISAERLTTIEAWFSSSKDSAGNPAGDSRGTNVNFLYAGDNAFPRLALDYAIGGVGTVGGVVGVRSSSGSYTSTSGVETDMSTVTNILVGARGGVILGGGSSFAFWLRGGVYHQSQTTTAPTTDSSWKFTYFSFDPAFMLVPVPHAALTFGPFLEAGVGSSEFNNANSGDFFNLSTGIAANLALLL